MLRGAFWQVVTAWALTSFATTAAAEELAYVVATSELEAGKLASSPYNLIDGNPATSWCSQRSPEDESIVFGFERNVTVTGISVTLADAPGEKLDKARRRAKTIVVSDGELVRDIPLKDQAGAQVIELAQPTKGTRVTLDLKEFYDGATDTAPICIAEVVLKSKGGTLTPASAATKAKALSSAERRLLSEWLDELSAPQRYLLLSLDGTFSFRFEPLLEGKPVKLRGKWTATERSLNLEWNGKPYRLNARLTKVDEGDTHTSNLTLSGEGPHSSMNAELRPAPTKHLR
jgi:hypothetical protein